MAESLFSPNWYRVAKLKPRLRRHAQIHRHLYRGETWYVLQDHSSERFHRFSPAAYLIIGLMDGTRTVQQVWDLALAKLGDDAVSQDEVIQLLGQLHNADVLQCDVPPDTAELFRRRQKQTRQARTRKILSVFAWQVPLFDPEKVLNRTMPWLQPLFGWVGLLVWLGVLGLALVLGWSHWDKLSQNMLDQVLLPHNLLLLWVLFPVIKLVHEFGHAYAVKAFGGEVHEMGVMILVLTPVPYVDASSAWSFRSKWQRVLVGGAGMAIEVFIASLALFLWINLEPGILRALCYNTIIIAGISTVLFNANPLLRFDGYYMLMDYLEIPNLRQRATQYLIYLCERYLFGRREAEAPMASRSERTWFVLFSVSSFLYRVLVIVAILFFLGEISLLLGLIFAASTAFAWFVLPAMKITNFVFTNPRIRRVRGRAIFATLVTLAVVVALFTAVPLPHRTVSEGVIWVPEEGVVRARADGFVARMVATPGMWVNRGDVLVELEDKELQMQVQVLEAQLRELLARHRQVERENRVQAQLILEQLQYIEESLVRARERTDELTVVSNTRGKFVMPAAADLPGRFVRKGQTLAHVVDVDTVIVRTLVTQQDIDLVRETSRQIDVRLVERVGEVEHAVLTRVVPAASDQLPSPALGREGGGQVAVDPTDQQGKRMVQKLFEVDVELDAEQRPVHIGARAYVRFHHGWEPLGMQWYRTARQMFLSRLNV
jgi:putative peptide zinc metalloprotease protein